MREQWWLQYSKLVFLEMPIVTTWLVFQNQVTYSLVNSLYKITTESIKLVLDVEQFGAGSTLIVPTYNVQKVSFSFFWNAIDNLKFTTKSKTSINNSMLFALPAAQVLAQSSGFCGSRNFDLPNISVAFPIYFVG